jgi:hypothetical protein
MPPWRRKAQGNDRNVGLDSISFDTLGWDPQPQEYPNLRSWSGPGALLSAGYLGEAPDFPALEDSNLRTHFEEADRARSSDAEGPGGRPLSSLTRTIEVAAHRDGPLPLVRVLTRFLLPDPRNHFVGMLFLPRAECQWVIRLEAVEGPLRGIREALAGDVLLGELGRAPTEQEFAAFNPYEPRFDLDDDEPLTLVRRRLDRVEQSLSVEPAVLALSPFGVRS